MQSLVALAGRYLRRSLVRSRTKPLPDGHDAGNTHSWPRPVNGRQSENRMSNSDDLKKTIRFNKLLGMWAAEKLRLTGRDVDAYSDALAVGTLDPERSDVFSKIRKDFDAAGVVQSDEQILRVMNELTLQ